MKKLIGLLAILLPLTPKAETIWSHIPFVRTADLCRAANPYFEDRAHYLDEMLASARRFFQNDMEALSHFEASFYSHRDLALRGRHYDRLFEATFMAFVDGYYRDLKPRERKLFFSEKSVERVTHFAHGTYALASNCGANVRVTLSLLSKDGNVESFTGEGHPEVVMSKIAAQVFTRFQRTSFPSTLQVSGRELTLIGGLNGSVDRAISPQLAAKICHSLKARLPHQRELEIIHSYGDWSGGVALGTNVWAMPEGKVYHPALQNPSPVRNVYEVNAKEYFYYCVR